MTMSPSAPVATPRLSVMLYKTISRQTVDGQAAVSARYAGKKPGIDLTPFLNDTSAVRTTKSVREPAGAFSISFADKAEESFGGAALESIYGLVEPMDLIEIRAWGGRGNRPGRLPIVMRGFVSEVRREQSVDGQGRPVRTVVIAGQDYGKIWQMFQVIYLAAYAEGKPLLTNFSLWEIFGIEAKNTLPAAEFVRTMIQKVINPHLDKFMPSITEMPRQLTLGDGITVARGVVNNSYQQMQGSVYDILKFHGDVGVWNELYTEDREDEVHVVYRPIPALTLAGEKIQGDAPDPVYVTVPADSVKSLSVSRSDANVANFFWVDGSRYDLITDIQRRLSVIPANDSRVSLKDYPNAAQKYYAVRPMYASTQQGDDGINNMNGGQSESELKTTTDQYESWIDRRRRQMMEMNRDNVVLEQGSASLKGGMLRPDGSLIRAGDYARFQFGRLEFDAYVVQVEHSFQPLQGYTTNVIFERGIGFVRRMQLNGGIQSPWLAEQATRF